MDEKRFQEMIQMTWEKIQANEFISSNIWAKLRLIRVEIKKWYQEVGINDPFRIAKLEEDIERLEKSRLKSQAC